jgi:hypothetical protein
LWGISGKLFRFIAEKSHIALRRHRSGHPNRRRKSV